MPLASIPKVIKSKKIANTPCHPSHRGGLPWQDATKGEGWLCARAANGAHPGYPRAILPAGRAGCGLSQVLRAPGTPLRCTDCATLPNESVVSRAAARTASRSDWHRLAIWSMLSMPYSRLGEKESFGGLLNSR